MSRWVCGKLTKGRSFYELIRFEVLNRAKLAQLEAYWEKSAIPAFNRLGFKQIGVFRSMYGTHGLDLFVLITHKNLLSFFKPFRLSRRPD